MNETLFDKVRLAREGAEVERCHTQPHLMRYSVGHHSLNLVTLLTLCWQEDHAGALPRAELLVAAAFHDVPEFITGDIPSPVKDLLGGIAGAEERTLAWLGVDWHLTPEEQIWLLAADRIELYLWCIEEAARGNGKFLSWVKGYNTFFTANPLPKALADVWLVGGANWGAGTSPEQMKEIARL